MNFGGIIETSVIDYPKKISTVLFTIGCNFACHFCHNVDLITGNTLTISEEELLSNLEKSSKLIEGVVLTGGEPTIYKDLPDFIKKVKDLGFSVKLDTNGSNPDMIAHLINNNLIDYIAMDIKHNLLEPNKYKFITGKEDLDVYTILESINLIKKSTIDYQFRTTLIKEIHTVYDIYEISVTILNADLYVLQTFRPDIVFNKEWSNYRAFTSEELNKILEMIKPNIKKIEII